MSCFIDRLVELVPGRVTRPCCPLPYISGNSTFYTPSPRVVVKADNDLPYAVQVANSLTSSSDSYVSQVSSEELLQLSKAADNGPQKKQLVSSQVTFSCTTSCPLLFSLFVINKILHKYK